MRQCATFAATHGISLVRLSSLILSACLLCCSVAARAASEADAVVLVESDDSLCLAHGGKLISLQLNTEALSEHSNVAFEVWVDRWFMQVQTADHTRHVLSAQVPVAELGCSQSMAGPQHWALSVIDRKSVV